MFGETVLLKSDFLGSCPFENDVMMPVVPASDVVSDYQDNRESESSNKGFESKSSVLKSMTIVHSSLRGPRRPILIF